MVYTLGTKHMIGFAAAVAVDHNTGALYVTDSNACKIIKINNAAAVKTIKMNKDFAIAAQSSFYSIPYTSVGIDVSGRHFKLSRDILSVRNPWLGTFSFQK